VTAKLRAVDVGKRFGTLTAVARMDLTVESGEVVAIIGPNGSGKSTMLNCIAGTLLPDRGRILLDDRDITGLAPFRIARAGIGRTLQVVRVFPELTVLDNLLVAYQEHQGDGLIARLVGSRGVRAREREGVERARQLLAWVGLDAKEQQLGGTLSYGQRKLLSFAAALIPDPRLLLLDEPMAGVNPTVIRRLADRIAQLASQDKAVVIVEHNVGVVMRLATRVVVMHHGEKLAEGSPAEVRANPTVIDAYFGR
jgi:ABC-type branched-subunit amino acid transport system ATPase component